MDVKNDQGQAGYSSHGLRLITCATCLYVKRLLARKGPFDTSRMMLNLMGNLVLPPFAFYCTPQDFLIGHSLNEVVVLILLVHYSS
jgi:hypothetical protein